MEALCCKEGKLLCQQPDMVRNKVTKATLYILLMYTLFLLGIWRICPPAGGNHGKEGSVCTQHESSAAAISEAHYLKPPTGSRQSQIN